MLHFTSTVAQFGHEVPPLLQGRGHLLCDVMCMPMRLATREIPFLLAQRRRSIGKQLWDRRLVVDSGSSSFSSYTADSMRLMHGVLSVENREW